MSDTYVAQMSTMVMDVNIWARDKKALWIIHNAIMTQVMMTTQQDDEKLHLWFGIDMLYAPSVFTCLGRLARRKVCPLQKIDIRVHTRNGGRNRDGTG
jgi:hypothetical protein